MECTLCAENFRFFGLPECEHKEVCSLCWFRMLIQLKKNTCPVCRNSCDTIFILEDSELSYKSILATEWNENYPGFVKDIHSGLYFSNRQELERLSSFKKIFCRICREEFRNVNEYKNHSKSVHKKLICDQCMQSSKLFPAEQELYEESELASHKSKLHKKCNVCGGVFYDSNTLVAHIKNTHLFCDLCPFEQRIAFVNRESLEKHYIEKHFFCKAVGCREIGCFAFKKYEDFTEHYRTCHPGLIVPPPPMGFKVKSEEEKFFFEDNNLKGSKTEVKVANSIDFPALGNPSRANPKALDYSKVIKSSERKEAIKIEFAPPPRSESKNDSSKNRERKQRKEEIKYSNPPGYLKAPSPKNKISELEKYLDRCFSGYINRQGVIDYIISNEIPVEYALFDKIRSTLSNSDAEWIINDLREISNRKNNKPAQLPEKKHEFEEEKKTPRREFKDQASSLPEKITSTLLENICLLNSGLIDIEDFITSSNEFIPRNKTECALDIIRGNLVNKSQFTTISRSLKADFSKKQVTRKPDLSNNRFQESKKEEKPNVAQCSEFPTINEEELRRLEETLVENLQLFKSKLISINELVRACNELLEPHQRDFAYSVIKKNTGEWESIISKINESLKNNSKNGLKEIYLGMEPPKNRGGWIGRGRGRGRGRGWNN